MLMLNVSLDESSDNAALETDDLLDEEAVLGVSLLVYIFELLNSEIKLV